MPILACQLPAHQLGKHVHRALTAPLGGGQARASAAVSLAGTPIFLCAHPISCPSSLLELSAAEKPVSSQQPPPLPSHVLLCSAISELSKASSRQRVHSASGNLHSASLPPGAERPGSTLAVRPSPCKGIPFILSRLPDLTVTLRAKTRSAHQVWMGPGNGGSLLCVC